MIRIAIPRLVFAWIAAVVLVCTALPAELEAQRKRHPRVQTGYATYYAKFFDGRETASGETFDVDKMVAAHRTLPFDSVVQVTNLENGRKVRVRIVDRGPYKKNWREGTIIDVSPAAARRLGMLKDGQVRARVRVLKQGPDRAPES